MKHALGALLSFLALIFPAAGGTLAAQQPAMPAPPAEPGSPAFARSPGFARPAFSVVLDAAHGGTDSGAHLALHVEEKDLALSLTIRLRSMLAARGIAVVTTRETDTTLAPAARAALANARKASACLILHATDSGSGIHLFTSSLAPAPPRTFLPWETAQAAYLDRSLRFSSEINSAMTHAGIPVTLGRTALQPLDNMTCPAAAVEIAPLTRNGAVTATLEDADYQSRILAALAAAIEGWRRDWLVNP
jgi:N-acetylmuramoyl-L-alanine amidase